MSPRPIHRWKSLWLGILVLLYLGWAWRASTDTFTITSVNVPGRWLAVSQLDGEVGIFRGQSSDYTWHADIDRRPALGSVSIDQAYWANSNPYYSGLIITHGSLILLFLALGTALLALRWLRLKRLSSGSNP